MADSEGEMEALLDNFSPSPAAFKDLLRGNASGEAVESSDSLENLELREEASLLPLADVALAPSCGRSVSCSQETRSLRSTELQLQFFLSKADDLHDCLVSGTSHLDSEALAAAVSSLLYTCQPFFNRLESAARSAGPLCAHTPADFCLKLLDFSQQLSDRLEQLLLTFASYGLISLEEDEPNSTSHFCIGQIQTGQMRLTTFRYCKPTPFLSQVDTGVFKRMRWNVERLLEEQERGQGEEEIQTDFYFLCYEDIPNTHADPDTESKDGSNKVVRMWSIGQWVQVNPDPSTEDILDWILCEVPEASYNRLLFLGPDEPSSCMATDYLQQLLPSVHAD